MSPTGSGDIQVGSGDLQPTSEAFGTLQFQPTATEGTILCLDISITDDDIVENNENFTVTIVRGEFSDQIEGPGSLTVIIIDNDGKPSICVHVCHAVQSISNRSMTMCMRVCVLLYW